MNKYTYLEWNIKNPTLEALVLLFGPGIVGVVTRPQIEEWENEGGAIR